MYEAFQESLCRHVAVKVLPRQSLLDAKHLQRFERESQTAARLHHTNIVPVFGVGEQNGFHYIVMQLIRGVGLDAILAWIQQAFTASGAATNEDIGAQPPSSSAGETARLARLLMQGGFWQSKDSGISQSGPGQNAEACEDNQSPSTPAQSSGAARRPKIFRPRGAPRLPGAAIRLQAHPRPGRSFPRPGDSAPAIGGASPQWACKWPRP